MTNSKTHARTAVLKATAPDDGASGGGCNISRLAKSGNDPGELDINADSAWKARAPEDIDLGARTGLAAAIRRAMASDVSPSAVVPQNQPHDVRRDRASSSDLPGRTTTAAARLASGSARDARETDDLSPLLSRRQWIGLAWGAFTAASAVALASTGRMMFPNVLNEPAQHFKAGFPREYGVGVDERWKDAFGVWLVRTADDLVQDTSGFYALIAVCTHLGCTPNYLASEQKFKCPCHGSGFRLTGINFEGPAPRPLERAAIRLADDGQILVDKSRHFQFELGQWSDAESFLRA